MTTSFISELFKNPELRREWLKDSFVRRGLIMIILGIIGYILLFVYLPWQGALGVVIAVMVGRNDHEYIYHKYEKR